MTPAKLIEGIRHAAAQGYTVRLEPHDGLAVAGEVARLTEAVRVAERAATKARRDAYAEIAAWLTARMDHPEARLSDKMLLRELIDVLESGEVPRG